MHGWAREDIMNGIYGHTVVITYMLHDSDGNYVTVNLNNRGGGREKQLPMDICEGRGL
jgi:hypothetical protein